MARKKQANRRLVCNPGIVFYAILFFGLISWATAQAPRAPVPGPAVKPPSTPGAFIHASTNQPAPELKFEDATLNIVLKEYGEATRRTLLLDPKLPAPAKGITLRNDEGELTMEEYLQAIETVLAMNGIGLIKVGEKFLKVVPIETARQEGMSIRRVEDAVKLKDTDELVSQMIQLRHIDVAEGTKLLETLKFQHPYGKVHAFERTNCILFTDTAANVSRVLEILKSVDQPIEIREEPKVVALRYAKATNVKLKLEEIIQESQKDQSTVPKLKDKGSPGVVTPATAKTFTAPVAPPGVIRPIPAPHATESAPVAASEAALAQILDEAERGIIRGKVKIVADDRTNIMIIITRPENMQFFEKIINVLDVATEPDVTVKVLRLEFADAEQVATMLNTLIGAQVQSKDSAKPTPGAPAPDATRSAALADAARQREALTRVADGDGVKSKVGELSAQNIKILADKRINSLIIMAPRLDLATIEEIVKEMDMAVSQVLIEVIILDINLGGGISTGIDWIQRSLVAYNRNIDGSRKPIMGFAGGGGGGANSTASLGDLTMPFSTGAGLTYYLTHYGLNADAILKMSANDNRSRVLSSPIILTTDNKKAQLDVTTEKYFYKGQNYVSTGVGSYNSVDNVDMKSVGIKLAVTPHINKSRNVQMEITQEISNADAEQAVGTEGAKWPIMAVNKFDATVSVRSGMTIVLGGLANESKKISHSKIPVLGDLPLLGLLFGSSDKSKSRHEILVFLTPYVMDNVDEIEADALRRQASIGEDGKWTRGWSNSRLGDANKTEVRDQERHEREMEKKAKTTAGKYEAEARARALIADSAPPAIEAMGNIEAAVPAVIVPSAEGSNTITNRSVNTIDPAIADFIKRNEKRYDKDLRKIDQRIQGEIFQSDLQKKQ